MVDELLFALEGFDENIVFEEASLPRAVFELHDAETVLKTLVPVSLVHLSICPLHLSVPLLFVFEVVSFVTGT
jgi:hypothetical protein